jgi:hypothetical protein
MSREPLHNLIDRIPEEELPAAKRFLEYLVVSPAYRAALSAPTDDEPVTEADSGTEVCLQRAGVLPRPSLDSDLTSQVPIYGTSRPSGVG